MSNKKCFFRKCLAMVIAGIVNAFGVTVFIAPVKLYDSGISGTSILLSQITPEFFSLPFFLLVLNIPLFLFGLKKQGKVFTVCSICAVLSYSLFSFLIEFVLPIDVSIASPLAGSDLLLCALFGGVISGVGSGLAIRYGGAMDGIEVMAVIFAPRLGITIGTFVMLFNLILYVFSGFILRSWILPLYSIVTYFAGQKAVDFVVEGINRSKAAMIVTSMPSEVCAKLSDVFGKGITTFDARGYYSGDDKVVVYMVVHWFQIPRVKEIVHNCDKNAFITISEIANVFPSNQTPDTQNNKKTEYDDD